MAYDIDPAPTPPTTTSPSTFSARADAFVAWQADELAPKASLISAQVAADSAAAEEAKVAALAAAASAVGATGYVATSASSVSLTAGAKVFTLVESARLFANGDRVRCRRRSDPSQEASGLVSAADMTAKTMTVTFDEVRGSGGPYTDWIVMLEALAPENAAGRHAIWIPAAAITPRATSGCGATVGESSTNKVVLRTLDFDATVNEHAQFNLRMPKGWDEGTVTFVPVWIHGATTTNFGVTFGLRAVALSNTEATDAAFGTAQYSEDTGGTTNALYVGPESAAITIAGTPAAEDWVAFEILRNVGAGADTLAVDAKLLGVTVYCNMASGNDE